MTALRQIILIHPDAPPKPVPGAPCNGCGVCCQLAPCPLGLLLSRRRHGACVALRWHEALRQYRCGALSQPLELLQSLLPRPAWRLAAWLAPALAGLARRSIAVDQGCDSSVEVSAWQAALMASDISSTMRHDSARKRP